MKKLATLAATTAVLGLAGSAQAATYYNIVNADSGKALATDPSGKLKLVTPNPHSLAQQWKRTEYEYLGPDWFSASIRNRLGSCLVDDGSLDTDAEPIVALRTSTCTGASKSRRMWSHLRGRLTATPSIAGYQLVNDQTARYAYPEFCFFTCTDHATLLSASLVSSDPEELGASAKWRYRFAVNATP